MQRYNLKVFGTCCQLWLRFQNWLCRNESGGGLHGNCGKCRFPWKLCIKSRLPPSPLPQQQSLPGRQCPRVSRLSKFFPDWNFSHRIFWSEHFFFNLQIIVIKTTIIHISSCCCQSHILEDLFINLCPAAVAKEAGPSGW